MEKEELKSLLQKYGLRPNFTYGQNFLIDGQVLEDIVASADVKPVDTILEIGPGIGNLTRRLADLSKFVLSIEKDPKFLPILKSVKKEYKNFQYEITDALEYNFQEALKSANYKVVANIPYYITGKILRMLLNAKHKPLSITVLTQYEVAQQIAAKAGEMSLLTLSIQLYGDAELVRKVPAKAFYPAPKVDSAIVNIKLFEKPKYSGLDEKKFFSIVKACFSGKRKQIHNTLANALHGDKKLAESILKQAGVGPDARPQELSLEQWVKIVEKIY